MHSAKLDAEKVLHHTLRDVINVPWDSADDFLSSPDNAVVENDRIVSIDLEAQGLTGRVDLTQLPSTLRHLDLSVNDLSGSVELGALPDTLESLLLSVNKFQGGVNFTRLPRSLRELSLAENEFSGPIDFSSLPPGIEEMFIGSNKFDSCGPEHGVVTVPSTLPESLRRIHLDGNTLLDGTVLDVRDVPSTLTELLAHNISFREVRLPSWMVEAHANDDGGHDDDDDDGTAKQPHQPRTQCRIEFDHISVGKQENANGGKEGKEDEPEQTEGDEVDKKKEDEKTDGDSDTDEDDDDDDDDDDDVDASNHTGSPLTVPKRIFFECLNSNMNGVATAAAAAASSSSSSASSSLPSLPTFNIYSHRQVKINTNQPLGRGGQAHVYRGTILKTTKEKEESNSTRGSSKKQNSKRVIANDTDVAAKVFPHAPQASAALRGTVAEVKRAHLLDHPNIVRAVGVVLDVSAANMIGVSLLLELAEGSLDTVLRRGGALTDYSKALNWAQQIASGLDYLHRNLLIHLDIKLGNILSFNNETVLKLTDFGLSHQRRGGGGTSSAGGHETRHTSMTKPGHGTLGFAPPEQCRGERVSTRSDVFSFGAVLFCLICGRFPPANRAPRPQDVVPLECMRGTVLEDVCKSCLADDPDERPTDGTALAIRLGCPMFTGSMLPATETDLSQFETAEIHSTGMLD